VEELALISIVEDDASVGRAIRRLVAADGLRAEAFPSAEAFLESPVLAETACLILDLRLPGMSGLELQTRLAALRPSLPIVFITSYPDDNVRTRALKAGAIAFLCKPFREQDLKDSLRAALGIGKSEADRTRDHTPPGPHESTEIG
jgi:FixJ family two-component response regulator